MRCWEKISSTLTESRHKTHYAFPVAASPSSFFEWLTHRISFSLLVRCRILTLLESFGSYSHLEGELQAWLRLDKTKNNGRFLTVKLWFVYRGIPFTHEIHVPDHVDTNRNKKMGPKTA